MSQLQIPRGTPGQLPMALDMAEIYAAERRLNEVALATPDTAPMLMGFFNQVCNTTTKYLSWIEFEILQAEKHHGLAKATVILEKAPEEYSKLKATGIKYNEDFRDAMIARDEECQTTLDKLNSLIAVRALLDNKAKTFVRAYNATRSVAERRGSTAAIPNFNARIGELEVPSSALKDQSHQTADDFMGVSDLSARKRSY